MVYWRSAEKPGSKGWWTGEFMQNRREFLRTGVAGVATAVSSQPAPATKLIGIQVGAVSFVDEGTDKVLDIF